MSYEYWCMNCKEKTRFKRKTARWELKDYFFIPEANPSDVVPRHDTLVLLLLDKNHPIASQPTIIEKRINLPE